MAERNDGESVRDGSTSTDDTKRLPNREAALIAFLKENDIRCPDCKYNLRNLESTHCPECQRELVLLLEGNSPSLWPFAAAIAPFILTLGFIIPMLLLEMMFGYVADGFVVGGVVFASLSACLTIPLIVAGIDFANQQQHRQYFVVGYYWLGHIIGWFLFIFAM